jgi:hypothetical protein
LSALRERMEARLVLQSKMDMRAARRGDELEMDGEEAVDAEEEEAGRRQMPVRGINARDRLTFEWPAGLASAAWRLAVSFDLTYSECQPKC